MSLQRQLRRLFSSLENDERDLEIARLKKELTAWEYHSGAKLMNCLITPRDDEYGSGLFRGNQKTISCCLVGYAIVPLEKYEAQEKRIKALEGALRGFACNCGPFRCMAHGDDTDKDDCERHREGR